MSRYRIAYRDHQGTGLFRDVEADRLADAIWELAKELCGSGVLVDTMSLPSTGDSYPVPRHVDLYPDWTVEE